MDRYLITPKRKMAEEITEQFVSIKDIAAQLQFLNQIKRWLL